jgi:hypothetical protein
MSGDHAQHGSVGAGASLAVLSWLCHWLANELSVLAESGR